jgi:ATP-dependent helicase/nuclease subunit B
VSGQFIYIAPWNADFIDVLAERLTTPARLPDLARTRLVFPHNRPARHLRAALAKRLTAPALLPRMQSLDEFLRTLRQDLAPEPTLRAGKLDRIGALYAIIHELGLGDGPLAALKATKKNGAHDDSARIFFPWGARLASLLEEMAGQNVHPAAIHNLAGEVSPWAEALLGQLDAIGTRYHKSLAERGWTTPGMDSLWLSEHLDALGEVFAEEHLVFAGFHAMSGTEEAILRRLWDQGAAEICWHTDPVLATGGSVAWAAREHKRWLDRWHARAVLIRDVPPETPQIRRFYEGFDLHSQLSVLERKLAALPDTDSTAIVLPDPGALVPVMHHLPAVEANISMGYPLGRSALAQLVETVLTLHENADGNGRYVWRDLVALVRHPLLRMLRVNAPGDAPGEGTGETPLKSAYVAWERHIRSSGATQSPEEWLLAYDTEDFKASENEVRTLHEEVLDACFRNFRGITTLRQLGLALDALCALLRRRGGDTWRTHLIDAECLLRLWQSVVPELTGSILADETYDLGLLLLILRHLIDAERVSFEPEPLAGMQVLGMLETRLLTFERLFILDATEDKLPGVSPPDPLLPDPLRQALGLPGRRERDNVAAHNFFRLLMGAREVTVLYQAGVRPGALEGKSERSRYVEQLLWELEQRQGSLIKPQPMTDDEAPLKAVSFPVCPILPHQPGIIVTPAIRAKLARRLADKGVTPSNLEVWISCPKKAFYAQVLGLRPLKEVAENGDRAQFGEIVHRVLKEFLAPHLGKPIFGDMLDAGTLTTVFEQALTEGEFLLSMPYDARVALLAAGRERLKRFLGNLPATTVVALEHPILTNLSLTGIDGQPLDLSLHGRIDRIDLRAGKHMVLDYKTGGAKSGGAQTWLDEMLFARVAKTEPGTSEAAQLLAEFADSDLDVQLPLYLHLLTANEDFLPNNAAWIELKSDGAERPLFNEKATPEERASVMTERAPALVRLVLEHALVSPELSARPGRHCQWCDFKGLCCA